jgi:hypothetical protein
MDEIKVRVSDLFNSYISYDMAQICRFCTVLGLATISFF